MVYRSPPKSYGRSGPLMRHSLSNLIRTVGAWHIGYLRNHADAQARSHQVFYDQAAPMQFRCAPRCSSPILHSWDDLGHCSLR